MNNDNINEPQLFSEEEMLQCESDTMRSASDKQEPVSCLGMEFESDDARREYFRNELRRRLPELRQIEGFPIGEDDDIIALSDPPYYTACPNPWLNDFINQWEEEKQQLEAEGKRSKDFEVTEPYASDVSEGKNNPIYMAHAYHTKVPHPAIMRYILHYTQPGDIVFDGFCGTGMTGVAAQLCGSENDVKALGEKYAKIGVRHGICSDLSPIASLITASYNRPFNAASFVKHTNNILSDVNNELGWMYETTVEGHKAKINYTIWSDVFTCPACGKEIVLWDEVVSEDTKTVLSTFNCPHCGAENKKTGLNRFWETTYDDKLGKSVKLCKKVPVRINYILSNGSKGEKKVDDGDLEVLRRIEAIPYPSLPTYALGDGEKMDDPFRLGITYTHQMYTKRNLLFLSAIRKKFKTTYPFCLGSLLVYRRPLN